LYKMCADVVHETLLFFIIFLIICCIESISIICDIRQCGNRDRYQHFKVSDYQHFKVSDVKVHSKYEQKF
jgi:hypothetical protein